MSLALMPMSLAVIPLLWLAACTRRALQSADEELGKLVGAAPLSALHSTPQSTERKQA